MTTLNDFIKYYKTISNTELLSILENPDDYQPLAIEAAQKEFLKRQLSDTEIKEAKDILLAKQVGQTRHKERIKAIEEKVRTTGHTLVETLNPIQPKIHSAEKAIRLIVIVFGGIFLYQFISDFWMHMAFIEEIPQYPLQSGLYVLPLILLPAAVITFWIRKPIGWILLTIYLAFSAIVALWLLIDLFNWEPLPHPVFAELFPRPSLTAYIFPLAFYIGSLYALSRAEIRQVFSISTERMAITIIVTGLITVVLMYLVFRN